MQRKARMSYGPSLACGLSRPVLSDCSAALQAQGGCNLHELCASDCSTGCAAQECRGTKPRGCTGPANPAKLLLLSSTACTALCLPVELKTRVSSLPVAFS